MNRKQHRAKGNRGQQEPKDLNSNFAKGYKLYKTKSYGAAEKIFKTIARQAPHHAQTQYILGSIYLHQKKPEKALPFLKEAIQLKPGDADYYNALGKALKETERPEKAVECFIRALDLQPDYADAHFQIVLLKQTHPEIEIDLDDLNEKYASPALATAYKNIGVILSGRDQFDHAIASLTQAVKLQPENAELWCCLSLVHLTNNQNRESIHAIKKAVEYDPDNETYMAYFSFVIANKQLTKFDKNIKMLVEKALTLKNISLQLFVSVWHSLLLLDDEFREIQACLKIKTYEDFTGWHRQIKDTAFFKSPYLLEGIKKFICPNGEWEMFLTHNRRYLLDNVVNETIRDDYIPFLLALSEQCFLNEYLYNETNEEKENRQKLLASITGRPETLDDQTLLRFIAAISCYEPIHQWLQNNALRERCRKINHPGFQDMLRIQMDEPLEEQKIKKQIESIGNIQNRISQKVREQYEENPYPRWQSIKTVNTGMNDTDILPDRMNTHYDVLLPGCGTGQQSIQNCVSFPKSDILAVDLSLSSLAYAVRKTREYGFDNITYRHGDILQLKQLDRQFDVIECTGVLHHMEDPMAGWRVLTGLLKPGGYMKLGLYSELARQDIVEARQIIADIGLKNTPDDIRKGRREIKARYTGKNFGTIMIASDFYSLSMCRDLLFHVQEHRFTIPEIKQSLKDLNLDFRSFSLPNAQVMHAYKKMFPEDTKGKNLDNWQKFEEKHPTTFAKMYQFWAEKPLS